MIIESQELLEIGEHAQVWWQGSEVVVGDVEVNQIAKKGDMRRQGMKVIVIGVEGRQVGQPEDRGTEVLQSQTTHVESGPDCLVFRARRGRSRRDRRRRCYRRNDRGRVAESRRSTCSWQIVGACISAIRDAALCLVQIGIGDWNCLLGGASHRVCIGLRPSMGRDEATFSFVLEELLLPMVRMNGLLRCGRLRTKRGLLGHG